MFGRRGNNPETPSQVWCKQSEGRFRETAITVEKDLHFASQILPIGEVGTLKEECVCLSFVGKTVHLAVHRVVKSLSGLEQLVSAVPGVWLGQPEDLIPLHGR